MKKKPNRVQQYYYITLHFFTQDVVNNQEARGVEIQFLLDTGASASIINYDTFLELPSQAHIPLQPSKVKLIAANAQPIPAKGECSSKFYYHLEGTNA